jgi:RNA polymerase sigma-70 factor (ECF subfamily)
MLSSALAQMPERTRYAFEMYKLHGRTQNDIAKDLGVSPTLVNFMVRDALLHCRQALKRMESKAR